MVKNLSNPLNARKVAKILADDTSKSGHHVDERDISVFFSDHRVNDFTSALHQLKQMNIIPGDYKLSDEATTQLLNEQFIDQDSLTDTQVITGTETSDQSFLGEINSSTIEFRTQFDSLKNKLIKLWSGGISIEGHELDNFDRKFARPMKYFKEQMGRNDMSDLQAFAVVYATDQLSLGDNSKEDVYFLMFGRFDECKQELHEQLGFDYSWPQISGTSFIEIGKKYSIAPELAEFGKKFRGVSGLDTYPDEVIQMFFYNLITGKLIPEMIEKKMIFRWVDEGEVITNPLQWLLPPPDFNMDSNLRKLMTEAVISHTLLLRIESNPPSLVELINEIRSMGSGKRSGYLAKKIEAALTRKSVALQFGTTLANSFENFKINPAKINPFLDTTIRYFTKADHVNTILGTVQHSIKTALKNSTGLIKEYLRNISDEELENTIKSNLRHSLVQVIEQHLPDFAGSIIADGTVDYDQLDQVLRTLDMSTVKLVFTEVFNQLYNHTNQYAKSLEPEKREPQSNAGGLTELTHDFESTVRYHGSKNPQTGSMINSLVQNGLDNQIAESICYISSYMTYQVASKEGKNGESMLMSLVKNYEQKAHSLGTIPLTNGMSVKDMDEFCTFILDDLRQAHVIVATASKLKSDFYNAWTPLDTTLAKATRVFNDLVMPNLLYWQRLPRDFIMDLVQKGLLDKSLIKTVVSVANRLTLVEAFSLLTMTAKPEINSLEQAQHYLKDLFNEDEIVDDFIIRPRSGEAEIALEAIYLWTHLQEIEL